MRYSLLLSALSLSLRSVSSPPTFVEPYAAINVKAARNHSDALKPTKAGTSAATQKRAKKKRKNKRKRR